MKKVFRLEGLDCAHCAAKIEERVSKLEGVKSVVINFKKNFLIIYAFTIFTSGSISSPILSVSRTSFLGSKISSFSILCLH